MPGGQNAAGSNLVRAGCGHAGGKTVRPDPHGSAGRSIDCECLGTLAKIASDGPVGKKQKARALSQERIGLPSHTWSDSTVRTTRERPAGQLEITDDRKSLFSDQCKSRFAALRKLANAACNRRRKVFSFACRTKVHTEFAGLDSVVTP
jgi:hypothetical protein